MGPLLTEDDAAADDNDDDDDDSRSLEALPEYDFQEIT